MAVKQTAGRDALGEFAPKFAELNDDVLFGQVWSREDKLSLRDRSLVTVVALMAQGLTDESFRYHLLSAKKNGITREEIAEIVTHAAFYCGWPKAGVGGVPHGQGDLDGGGCQMILQETYTLANGIAIPKLGLGTWFIDNNKAAQAVCTAAELGYRLIDTAQAYGNERGVGEGIRTCGLKREELFVASKVAAEHKTYEDAARSIDETLEKMGLTYLDQMLIHSPQPWREFRAEKRYFQENRAVWRGLEDAQAAGKVRVIGVSNFLRDDLENLLTGCRVRPAVNQLLLHIAGTDLPLLDYCTRQDIRVEAYSPIAHGEALKNPAITAMAEKYGVSVPQLCIRYVLQLGAVALPKTADPGHMRSNAAVDFAISPEDMETLRSMEHLTDYGDYNGFPVFSGKPLA